MLFCFIFILPFMSKFTPFQIWVGQKFKVEMTSLDIKQLGGQIFFITRMGSEMGIKNNFFAKILLSGHNF